MICGHCQRTAGYHADRDRTVVGLAGALRYRRAVMPACTSKGAQPWPQLRQ